MSALGCGSPSSLGGASLVGVTDGPRPPRALNLTLVTPERTYIDLADLRGQTTLLFLFATFDGQSQAALRPLRRLMTRRPDVQIIGIALQPQARTLLIAWRDALHPLFPVAYEPDNRIARGLSELGSIEAVPTFVWVDEQGFARQRLTGYVDANALEELVAGGS